MFNDLATYIDSKLKELYPNFQWRIIKDSKKQLVELYFTFTVEVDEAVKVQDMLGKVNDSGHIHFEDVICFYDPAYSHIQPQNYLYAASFNSFTGIEKGFLDAILRQLNIVTTEGASNLKNFAKDVTDSEYELKWNDRNLQGSINTMKSTNRYNKEKIQINLDDERSLVEKLTKDEQGDGVERI